MIQSIVNYATFLLICSLTFLSIVGCEQKRKSDEYRFVEYLKVEGECFEDHVKQPAKYAGEIVHWYNATKGTDSRYGSVHHLESMNPERLLESIRDPYSYKPPFTVLFDDLKQEEIAGELLRIKGVSEHFGKDGNTQGRSYWATCELRVLERLDHIPGEEQRSPRGDRPKGK